jgi:hypothetical protein
LSSRTVGCKQEHDAQAEAEAKRQARLVRLRRKLAWVEQCIVDLDLAILRKEAEEAAAVATQPREAAQTVALQRGDAPEAAAMQSIHAAEHQPSHQLAAIGLTAVLPSRDSSPAPPLSLRTEPGTDGSQQDGGLLSAQTQSRSKR